MFCGILFSGDNGSFRHLTRPQGSAASVLVEDVLQLVLRGAHDSIPNVRFTAVRALQEMAPHLDAGAVDSQVRFSSSLSMVYPRVFSTPRRVVASCALNICFGIHLGCTAGEASWLSLEINVTRSGAVPKACD